MHAWPGAMAGIIRGMMHQLMCMCSLLQVHLEFVDTWETIGASSWDVKVW